MWMAKLILVAFVTAMLGTCCAFGAAGGTAVNIPFAEGVRIDGDLSDWHGQGFRVAAMRPLGEDWRSAANFEPTYRLAWDRVGLLIAIETSDSQILETDAPDVLWQRDCAEIWICGPGGVANSYQTAISTGADPRHPGVRRQFWDRRSRKGSLPGLAVEAIAKARPGGYLIEARLPWSNLGLKPAVGDTIGFQAIVDDSDSMIDHTRAVWHPRDVQTDPNADPGAIFTVRLARKADSPVTARAAVEVERLRRLKVSVITAPELRGRTVALRTGSKTLGSGVVVLGDDGRGRATIYLPLTQRAVAIPGALIYDGKTPIATLYPVTDLGLRRASALAHAELAMQYVFTGTQFPACDFQQPLLGEELIGPYSVRTTYYDSSYSPVKTADKPGRYGAVVEFVPRNGGRTVRRLRTLFRQPEPVDWWGADLPASMPLPEGIGVDPAVAAEQQKTVSSYLTGVFADSLGRDRNSAVVLAGLYEMKPGGGPAVRSQDVYARDRAWWVGLKRKLYGMDKAYATPVSAPVRTDGQLAPVLHEGSMAEAGMEADAPERIDKVLQAWAADSDQGFVALVARHGVIVLHKAYGMRDGKPMTLTTRSWMASNTKTLSALLMMMLVDRGLVSLDDPVAKSLPAMRGIKVSTPMTIRQLYTHTCGFPAMDHWGDELHDLDEVVADMYPFLTLGRTYAYNGVGYALGGKVIEAVSGECLPDFYRRHLLDPLGCANTEVTGTSYDAESVALDMGKIAQMLLNGGTYGDKRFFSKETLARMLPDRLSKHAPKGVKMTNPDVVYGIGLSPYDDEGLGKGTFGHGAASGATLRIDPVNDLVITMTRNDLGANYVAYHQRFIDAVVAGIRRAAGPPSR